MSIRFRCLENHDHAEGHRHGKYMSLPDEPARFYGVESIHQAASQPRAELHLAEGEFDSLILKQVFGFAGGIPGASGFTSIHRRMLAGIDRIWVWGDPDEAGVQFINRVTRSLRQARGVQLRIGDVTETYLAVGPEGLKELIEE